MYSLDRHKREKSTNSSNCQKIELAVANNLSTKRNDGINVSLSRTHTRENSFIRCSPKNDKDIENGKSCYETNGDLKPIWKRWLGI